MDFRNCDVVPELSRPMSYVYKNNNDRNPIKYRHFPPLKCIKTDSCGSFNGDFRGDFESKTENYNRFDCFNGRTADLRETFSEIDIDTGKFRNLIFYSLQ